MLGLAATAAVVLLVALPVFRGPVAPVIQMAILDTTGSTRGTHSNETALLRKAWSTAALDTFTSAEALHDWQAKHEANTVKIIHDHAAAEVKVLGKWHGKTFEKTFPVQPDLGATLQKANLFIQEQTKR